MPLTYIKMSKGKEIICLANSIKKYPCRCVAGIDIETGQWIRPVSERGSGELSEQHYTTEQGHEPTPLDVLRVYLEEPAPTPTQPENWALTDRDWQLILEEPHPKHYQMLASALESGPEIFGNVKRAVSSGAEVDGSLALVEPESATIQRKPRHDKKDQPRLQFKLEGAEYNLPITGPRVKQKVFNAVEQAGSSQLAEHVDTGHAPLITISLGEEFEGKHWKLVAAICQVPRKYV